MISKKALRRYIDSRIRAYLDDFDQSQVNEIKGLVSKINGLKHFIAVAFRMGGDGGNAKSARFPYNFSGAMSDVYGDMDRAAIYTALGKRGHAATNISEARRMLHKIWMKAFGTTNLSLDRELSKVENKLLS